MLKCIKESIDDIATPKATPKDIIVSLIKQDKFVTINEMAIALGVNKRNAQNHVKKLIALGIIYRVGPNRGGHWELADTKE